MTRPDLKAEESATIHLENSEGAKIPADLLKIVSEIASFLHEFEKDCE